MKNVTIDIDARLLAEARRIAAETGRTLDVLVAEALREYIDDVSREAPRASGSARASGSPRAAGEVRVASGRESGSPRPGGDLHALGRRVPEARFVAECGELLEDVVRTGVPIVITRRGVPTAALLPIARSPRGSAIDWGDLVAPLLPELAPAGKRPGRKRATWVDAGTRQERAGTTRRQKPRNAPRASGSAAPGRGTSQPHPRRRKTRR